MKKKLFAAMFAAMLLLNACAQRGPLNGSGKLVQQNFSYSNFDKVELIDLAGRVEIEAGKAFSVSVAIDDNLASLLEASVSNQTLQLVLKGNSSNKLYIENTNILVKISMPAVSYVQQRGNNNLLVNGIKGPYFRLKNQDNGDTRLYGAVEELDITSNGNGNVDAAGVSSDNIKIHKSGNGDVTIHTDAVFSAIGSGNGDVINKGRGRADGNSGITGNGEIRYTGNREDRSKPAAGNTKSVQVTITNLTASLISLSVKYPVHGSYGIGLKPGETIVEALPVGAKIYHGNQLAVFKKPCNKVSNNGKEQSFSIH